MHLHSCIQVFVAAVKNRKLPLPESTEELHEIHRKDEDDEVLERTDQFKYVYSFPFQQLIHIEIIFQSQSKLN